MKVSIHQPDYIPYLGYFYKIFQSEVFVFLDDVQFSSDNFHHWNKIKTSQGEHRLKIPVEYSFGDKINQVRTKDELKWKAKHTKTIEMNYKKAKYFNDFYPKFKELLCSDYINLATMNVEINKYICEGFGIKPKFVLASELEINTVKEQRVIDIVKSFEGDCYISGNGAKAYQNGENFEAQGIKLIYTDYEPIEYSQLWKDFIPYLSTIDFVMNHGFDWEYVIRKFN